MIGATVTMGIKRAKDQSISKKMRLMLKFLLLILKLKQIQTNKISNINNFF